MQNIIKGDIKSRTSSFKTGSIWIAILLKKKNVMPFLQIQPSEMKPDYMSVYNKSD